RPVLAPATEGHRSTCAGERREDGPFVPGDRLLAGPVHLQGHGHTTSLREVHARRGPAPELPHQFVAGHRLRHRTVLPRASGPATDVPVDLRPAVPAREASDRDLWRPTPDPPPGPRTGPPSTGSGDS